MAKYMVVGFGTIMYELLVEADSREEARQIGDKTPLAKWIRYIPEDPQEDFEDFEAVDAELAGEEDIKRLS